MKRHEFKPLDIPFQMWDPDNSTLRETVPGNIYEPAVTAVLRRILAEKRLVFLDIGALYGYFCCFACKVNPDTEVHAFEPEPNYCGWLSKNIELNALDTVTVHDVALSDKTEDMLFRGKTLLNDSIQKAEPLQIHNGKANVEVDQETLRNEINNSKGIRDESKPVGLTRWLVETLKHTVHDFVWPPRRKIVKCVPFDSYAIERNLTPDVAKIDVHGAEVKVLRGMKRALKEDLSHVLLELHTFDFLVEGTHAEAVDSLIEAGFELHELRNFRIDKKWTCEKLEDSAIDALKDQKTWSFMEKKTMRMLYAKKPGR